MDTLHPRLRIEVMNIRFGTFASLMTSHGIFDSLLGAESALCSCTRDWDYNLSQSFEIREHSGFISCSIRSFLHRSQTHSKAFIVLQRPVSSQTGRYMDQVSRSEIIPQMLSWESFSTDLVTCMLCIKLKMILQLFHFI